MIPLQILGLKNMNKEYIFHFDSFEPMKFKGDHAFRVSLNEALEKNNSLLISETKLTSDKLILLLRDSEVWMDNRRFHCSDVVQKASDSGSPFIILVCERKPVSAQEYKDKHIKYDEVDEVRFDVIPILEFLKGEIWGPEALAYVRSARPSVIRVVIEGTTMDAVHWRVTVFIDEKDIIKSIEQEVEIGWNEKD